MKLILIIITTFFVFVLIYFKKSSTLSTAKNHFLIENPKNVHLLIFSYYF